MALLAIYCRISQDKEGGENRSIENQKALGIEKARQLGINYEVFIDQGLSGTLDVIEDRPGLFDMVNKIYEGSISAVFVTEQDRLERNPQMNYVLRDIFLKNNIRLFTSSQEVELDDPQMEFISSITSLINQFYVRTTQRKIKHVLSHRVKSGKAHGILPYGYSTDMDGYMVINEEESIVVKRIYRMSLEGIGTDRIARILNEEGIPTRYNTYGKGSVTIPHRFDKKKTRKIAKKDIRWSGKTIQGIIKNKVYTGKRSFSGNEYSCPSIVSIKEWNEVNEHLSQNRNNQGKVVDHKYMLKGIMTCGRCGRNMYGRTRTNKKDNVYICSSKRYKHLHCGLRGINIDILENFIWNQIITNKTLLEGVKQHFKGYETNRKNFETEYKKLQSEQNSLEGKRSKAIQLILDGILTEAELLTEKTRIDNQLEEVAARLEHTKQQIELIDDKDRIIDDVKNAVDLAKAVDVPWKEKRAIIRKFVKNIEIHYDDVSHYLIIIRIDYSVGSFFPIEIVMDWKKREPYIHPFIAANVKSYTWQWKNEHGYFDEQRKEAEEWLQLRSLGPKDI